MVMVGKKGERGGRSRRSISIGEDGSDEVYGGFLLARRSRKNARIMEYRCS